MEVPYMGVGWPAMIEVPKVNFDVEIYQFDLCNLWGLSKRSMKGVSFA